MNIEGGSRNSRSNAQSPIFNSLFMQLVRSIDLAVCVVLRPYAWEDHNSLLPCKHLNMQPQLATA